MRDARVVVSGAEGKNGRNGKPTDGGQGKTKGKEAEAEAETQTQTQRIWVRVVVVVRGAPEEARTSGADNCASAVAASAVRPAPWGNPNPQ